MKNNATKRAKTVERNQKTQDEIIAECNRARQPYLDLLKSLDDLETAREFRDKQFNRATQLISHILMITCGVFVEPENKDWAHEHLIEILEMFMVRHKNFDIPQFAEDLQEHIYIETMAYSKNSSNWKKAILAERGLDEYGIALAKSIEAETVLNLSEMSTKDTDTDDLGALANHISAATEK
ncbi:MAG: hypothetical protein M3388_12310 [Acidobacteriota bacterium]|nr:hypothetical protein [Acidobacteriota bacterium]